MGSAVAIKKTAAICAGAVIAAFILWMLTNASLLLKLDADERTLRSIDADTASVIVNEDYSTDIVFTDAEGVYIHRLLFEVWLFGEMPADIRIDVTCLDDGGAYSEHVYTDLNPIYAVTEAVTLDLDHIISICISGKGFSPSGFAVDNRFSMSIYTLLFGLLAGAGIASIIVFRDTFARRPELFFLVTASLLGFSMLIALPGTKVGYDEETHLQAVFAMASFPSGELHLSYDALNQLLVTQYNNPMALPGAGIELYELGSVLSAVCDYKTGAMTPDFAVILNRIPAYVAMAFALKAGKLLGLGWAYLIALIRLANLLTYIFLMYLAISLTPEGRTFMLFIALLPQNIFMACTASYDPFITACMCLGYAFMLKGKRYIIPMLICFALACLPKAVYAPVILMGLGVIFIPELLELIGGKGSRGSTSASSASGSAASSRRKKTMASGMAACAIVFVIFIAVFILPTVMAPMDTGDVRGGEVSMLGQVGFILGHPLQYAGILLSNMAETFSEFWLGSGSMTLMAHVLDGSGWRGYETAYRIILAMAFVLSYMGHKSGTSGDRGANAGSAGSCNRAVSLGLPVRVWMLLMVFAAAVLVWTAMYVAFTEPGASEIGGVQGRYFIPLLFPAYLAFSGDPGPAPSSCKARSGLLERTVPLCYYLLMVSEFAVLALTIWRTVISAFCL